MDVKQLANEYKCPRMYIRKIIEYNRRCEMRDLPFTKRAALIAQRLQNHDGIRITSRIIETIRGILEEIDPDAVLYDETVAYLHMVDVILRFFASQNDVAYRQGSVKFNIRPTISFDIYRTSRKMVKFQKFAEDVMADYAMFVYRDQGSLVVTGTLHDCFSPKNIEEHYAEIVKNRLVIIGGK